MSLSKPAAKPAAPKNAPKKENHLPGLLPHEIIESYEKFGDAAMVIETTKMRANKAKTTWFGNVKWRKVSKDAAKPYVEVPLNIMIVNMPVIAGCKEKTPEAKAKSSAHCATFKGSSTYEFEGRIEEYGKARVIISEIFERQMSALIKDKKVATKSNGKISHGVQSEVLDPDSDGPMKTSKKLERTDYIIRVEIPFKREGNSNAPSNDSEPDCNVRDIAQCKKVNGVRIYDKPVKVTIDGVKVPINYGNFHKFLVSGSTITGVERCDNWTLSSMSNGLGHKFPEIIVCRGTGRQDLSLADKLESSVFDKMEANAATDEQIEAQQKAEALEGAGQGTEDTDASGIPPQQPPPADDGEEKEEESPEEEPEAPEVKEDGEEEPEAEAEPEPEPEPEVKKPAAKKATETKKAPAKLATPANDKTAKKPAAEAKPAAPTEAKAEVKKPASPAPVTAKKPAAPADKAAKKPAAPAETKKPAAPADKTAKKPAEVKKPAAPAKKPQPPVVEEPEEDLGEAEEPEVDDFDATPAEEADE